MDIESKPPQPTYYPLPTVYTPSRTQKFLWALKGAVLSPWYWFKAFCYKTPGLALHKEFAQIAIRLLVQRRVKISKGLIYTYIFWPMDSTRYLEFDFTWKALTHTPIHRYLDIASPRLLPLLVLLNHEPSQTDLLNPDIDDLEVTNRIVQALNRAPNCRLKALRVDEVSYPTNTFDVITSISVIEHIPDDKTAVAILWDALRPGGKLIITVPCAAHSHVFYTDHDNYNVQSNAQGHVHLYYIYDQLLLEQHIWSITGPPTNFRIYGEKQPGWLRANLESKAQITGYPYWKEPYFIGSSFRIYQSINDLPGEGVICMEFTKSI